MILHTLKQQAYTLIEVLIALMIFAILASMSTQVLHHFLTQYQHIHQNYTFWHKVDKLIQDMQYQTYFSLRRPVRANEGHMFPAFIGQHDYMEWSYSGPHETLHRIAYVCRHGQLKQRTWSALDPLHREDYVEKILFDKLKNCGFRYLNSEHKIDGFWNSDVDITPHGIQLNLTWNEKQKLQFWFALPPVRYDSKT